MAELLRYSTPAELYAAAHARVRDAIHAAIDEFGTCSIALSGGKTPQPLYQALAREPLPWTKTKIFFADERCVPPHHVDSNYRMVQQTLLEPAHVSPANVFRVPAEVPEPERAAEQYEGTIRTALQLRRRQWPRFDVMLLGIGDDGHTASLFPGSPALDERDKIVASAQVEKLRAARITLTLPAINASALILFLVQGAEKAAAVQAVLEGRSQNPLPAARVKPMTGKLVWMMDETAASKLG